MDDFEFGVPIGVARDMPVEVEVDRRVGTREAAQVEGVLEGDRLAAQVGALLLLGRGQEHLVHVEGLAGGVDEARPLGLDQESLQSAFTSSDYLQQLEDNWAEAQELGLFGVPSFKVGEELFWGSDRIEYVLDHLNNLRLRKV